MEMLGNEDDTKDIPIIFLISIDDAETVNEVLKLKPQGYILKTTPEKVVIKYIADFFSRNK